LEWDGERRTLKEWAKVAGLTEGGLRARLKVMGMGEALRRHRR
jgi:transcription initiation factor TFIIIB Brf1 subunit/transcription initiation factor TFIIB